MVYVCLSTSSSFSGTSIKKLQKSFFCEIMNSSDGLFHDHGRYICMSVVRQKSLEQIHNNKQLFPFTLFMADRCYIYSCMLSEKLIKITIIQKFTFK